MGACITDRVRARGLIPANKSLRGSRGPEAGVRGIPPPFINLDERGRDTPHPSLLPLLPRKDFLDEVLGRPHGAGFRYATCICCLRRESTSRSAATQSSSSLPAANPRRSARKYASAATSRRRASESMRVDSSTAIAAPFVNSGAAAAVFCFVVFFTGDTRFVAIILPPCLQSWSHQVGCIANQFRSRYL